MKKAVLISIQPKWCKDIANLIKRIEVRKKAPKLQTPFKAYIYCTQAKNEFEQLLLHLGDNWRLGNGKVIGEFVCDKVDTYDYHKGLTKFGGELGLPIGTYDSYMIFEDDYKAMCLTYDEVKGCGKGKTLYGLHISQLKIYDKPKKLGEFKNCAYPKAKCLNTKCEYWGYSGCEKRIIRPPQSWCYVEELSE